MSTGHVVARIGKPHALRGEVTVQLHTDEPEVRLVPGAVLTTRAQPGSGVPRQLTIATTRVHRGIWLIGFEGIPDRTGAESLRGTRLVLDDDAVLAPADDDTPLPHYVVASGRAVPVRGALCGEHPALSFGGGQGGLRLGQFLPG